MSRPRSAGSMTETDEIPISSVTTNSQTEKKKASFSLFYSAKETPASQTSHDDTQQRNSSNDNDLNVATNPSSSGGSSNESQQAGQETAPLRATVPSVEGSNNDNENEETSSTSNNNENEDNNNNNENQKKIKLYKSPRFKGYLTILLASVINYHSVDTAQYASDISAVTPSTQQVAYGMTVALLSCIITGWCILFHLDNYSCFANIWKNKLFASKSKFETLLVLFLLIWWFIATCVQTGVRGVAGDGKEQYNIYYSTWCCFLASLFCVESKLTEYDWPSFKTFIKSWPYRAPGWIAIFICDFFVLFWYVDLYINTAQYPDRVPEQLAPLYRDIPQSQYEWLIFVASATLLPSAVFIFVEIFRDSSKESNEKPPAETLGEGICLLVLTLSWIPTVVVATTPGGFASVIGNAYFFTWATTVFVLQTTMWFVHDSRGGVHQTLLQKEEEYTQHQKHVLEATKKMQQDIIARRQELGIDENDDNLWQQKTIVGRRKDTEDQPIFGQESMLSDNPPVEFTMLNDTKSSTGNERIQAQHDPGFEMKNLPEDNEVVDESIQQEIRMREQNRRAYFDTLDDILE